MEDILAKGQPVRKMVDACLPTYEEYQALRALCEVGDPRTDNFGHGAEDQLADKAFAYLKRIEQMIQPPENYHRFEYNGRITDEKFDFGVQGIAYSAPHELHNQITVVVPPDYFSPHGGCAPDYIYASLIIP